MTTNGPISKSERAELRAVIRARARALKAGLAARRADQLAEVERRINSHYKAQRLVYSEADSTALEVVIEANKRIAEIYAPVVGEHPEWAGFAQLKVADPPDLERTLMRARANREVEAAAKAAESRLIHWEADALEAVARSGIESAEANAMLDQVATIESLMPMVELPAAAESTVDEMATDEGRAPYFQQPAAVRLLESHTKAWTGRNEIPDANVIRRDVWR